MNRRPYQDAALSEFVFSKNRMWALLWERQSGKSTTLADFALYEMFTRPNHTVIYASASLLLSQELPIKTAMRTSQTISQMVEGDVAILKRFADTAQSRIDAETRKPAAPVPDPFDEMCEHLNERAKTKNHVFRRNIKMDETGMWPQDDTSDPWPATVPEEDIEPKIEFKTYDAQEDREIKHYTVSDFANLFKQQRLEFRVYHSPTEYSLELGCWNLDVLSGR